MPSDVGHELAAPLDQFALLELSSWRSAQVPPPSRALWHPNAWPQPSRYLRWMDNTFGLDLFRNLAFGTVSNATHALVLPQASLRWPNHRAAGPVQREKRLSPPVIH